MKKILFICYGNVARSQMAEAYYNKFTSSEIAKSAGVGYGVTARYRHPAADVIKFVLEEGIDVSGKTVKDVTKDMVEEAEKVVVMCDLTDCPRYLTDSGKVVHIPITDPFGINIDYTRSVRDEIKDMVLELIHAG